jgi:hypothetical protein
VLLRVARGDAIFSDLGAAARTAVKAFVRRKAWEPLSWKREITLEQTLDFVRIRNVSVPADIRFILTENVGGAGYSLFGGWIGPLTRRITWSSLYRVDYIPIAIHPMALEIRTVAIKTVIEALFLLEELSAKFREKIDFPLGDLAVAISPGSLDSSLHRAIRRANHWIQEQMV